MTETIHSLPCLVCGAECVSDSTSVETVLKYGVSISEFLRVHEVCNSDEHSENGDCDKVVCKACSTLIFTCDEHLVEVVSGLEKLSVLRRDFESKLAAGPQVIGRKRGVLEDGEVSGVDFEIETEDKNPPDEESNSKSKLKRNPKRNRANVSMTCVRCNTHFVTSSAYCNHMRKYHPEDRVKCDQCDVQYFSVQRLEAHRAKAHGVQRDTFDCQICHTKLYTAHGLDKHVKECSAGSRRVCQHCGKSVEASKFNNHVGNHRRALKGIKKVFVCDICPPGVRFSHTISLKRHLHKVHNIGEKPVRPFEMEKSCPHCFKVYKNKAHFQAHLFNSHGIKSPNLNEYVCQVCSKTFFVKQSYLVHVGKHSNEPKFTCDVCGFKTSFSSSLAVHKKRHHRRKGAIEPMDSRDIEILAGSGLNINSIVIPESDF